MRDWQNSLGCKHTNLFIKHFSKGISTDYRAKMKDLWALDNLIQVTCPENFPLFFVISKKVEEDKTGSMIIQNILHNIILIMFASCVVFGFYKMPFLFAITKTLQNFKLKI